MDKPIKSMQLNSEMRAGYCKYINTSRLWNVLYGLINPNNCGLNLINLIVFSCGYTIIKEAITRIVSSISDIYFLILVPLQTIAL